LSDSGTEMVAVADLPPEARRLLEEQQAAEAERVRVEVAEMVDWQNLLRETCLSLFTDGYPTIGKASAKTGLGRRTIERAMAINSVETCQSYETFQRAKIGRGKAVPSPVVRSMQARAQQGDFEGGTVIHVPDVKPSSSNIGGLVPRDVDSSFSAVLHHEMDKWAEEVNPGGAMSQFKTLSDKTIRAAQKAIVPGMVIMKKGQNERRREALCDVYNFISLAVMMLIVYAHISGVSVREMERLSMDELQQDPRWVATVDRRLIFNIDKSTTFLGDTQDQLGFVAAGSKERLREKSRNATFQKTGEEDTRRSLGYTALTNAAGELIFFITHLRDHAFNGTASQKRPAKIHKVRAILQFLSPSP
jgi:hypothetical protein